MTGDMTITTHIKITSGLEHRSEKTNFERGVRLESLFLLFGSYRHIAPHLLSWRPLVKTEWLLLPTFPIQYETLAGVNHLQRGT